MPLGSLVTVHISSGKVDGSFVQVSAVINLEGVDYIYTAEQNGDGGKDGAEKTVRHQVELGSVYGDQVEQKNIASNLCVIVDGVKDLREIEAVLIAE